MGFDDQNFADEWSDYSVRYFSKRGCFVGVPALLVSKARRGFLDRLVDDGYPLFIAKEADESMLAAWLAGLHLTDALEEPDWPNTRSELIDLIKD